MSNMSYCRFENTSRDLSDCVEAIRDGETVDLNEYETRGLRSLVRSARRIVEAADRGDLSHVLED